MDDQSDFINKIIPADDLYWDEEENKFIALSYEEIDDIISSCYASGIESEDDIMSVVKWCTDTRVGQLLMKNFLNGSVRITSVDTDGEPLFAPS